MQITVRNVNEALPRAIMHLKAEGKPVAPRGMPTLEAEGPFITTYTQPAEMVLYDPLRDANPLFHFFETLWILHGREDVKFLSHFLPRMADFSDDGKVFHAPYGYRMRHGFGVDQIEMSIRKLSEDRDSRQAVISIWNPDRDWQKSRDTPCNDMVMFKIREGKLRMTVCNRSNDAILGAYGANVVQFSTLLKYMAGRIGVGIGTYSQVSDSFHVYLDNPYWQAIQSGSVNWPHSAEAIYDNVSVQRSTHGWDDKITFGECDYMPPSELGSGAFDEDMMYFFNSWDVGNPISSPDYSTNSFKHTVVPMYEAHALWKSKQQDDAIAKAKTIKALDWRIAVQQWMQRRINKQNQKPFGYSLTGLAGTTVMQPLQN